MRQYQEKLHRIHIAIPLEVYQRLSALAAETGNSTATVIRFVLTAENIDKAAEVLRAEAKREAQREDNQ